MHDNHKMHLDKDPINLALIKHRNLLLKKHGHTLFMNPLITCRHRQNKFWH